MVMIAMLPEVSHRVFLVFMLVEIALCSIDRVGNIVGIACQTFWRSFDNIFLGLNGFAFFDRVQYPAAP